MTKNVPKAMMLSKYRSRKLGEYQEGILGISRALQKTKNKENCEGEKSQA